MKDLRTRDEIAENINRSSADMDEKIQDLDRFAQDVQTVRETLAQLEFGGTSEGAAAVKDAIGGAESVTVNEFERADEQLDQTQSENAEFEQTLQEHSDTDRTDLEKVANAGSRIRTSETINELNKAKEAALRDIDFLAAQIERAKSARAISEASQQTHQHSVHRHNQPLP